MSVCSSRLVCTADGDFFVMKGVVEEFLEKAGMHKIPQYDPNAGQPSLHPGRQANILYDGEVIGFLGEVHPTGSG